MKLEFPPGATLAETELAAEQAWQWVSKVLYVKSVYTTIGGGAAGSDPFAPSGLAEVRKATLTIQLAERKARAVRSQPIEADMRKVLEAISGVRSTVGLRGSGEKYVLVLSGDDANALAQAASNVEKDLHTIPNLGSITSTASLVRPEIAVRPIAGRAAELGVGATSMAETLRVATVGDYDQAVAKMNLAQRHVPIVVRLASSARQDLDLLGRLTVPGNKGPVPQNSVATLEVASGPAVIDRYDRTRSINFEIALSGSPLGDVVKAAGELPSIKALPPGIAVREVGDAEALAELSSSSILGMLIGVLYIYIVLVMLFRDVLHPFTILAALPLSFGSAFLGLLVTGKSLSTPFFVGLIMFMGVATKNSILRVEYAIVARRDRGMTRLEALLDACHKRARPVLMTTIAMGACMLQVAIGTGTSDPRFRSPMAVAVIGGLIKSTFLSLLVIAPVFSLFDDIEHGIRCGAKWVGERFRRAPKAVLLAK